MTILLKAIKACKFMITMYSWRLNGCWIQIWSSCKKGLSTMTLGAANPLPVPQTRSQWCCASPARDVFPSCLVLPWHPQHPSYQARRYLNQSKGKTKRRMLVEIVRLTFRYGRCPENCLKPVQVGSGPPQQETRSYLPGPGASARWDWRPEIASFMPSWF